MGFWDSLGISFIDDDTDLVEQLAGEDSSQESESQKAAPKTKGSRISDYSKEDLIVFLMVLMLGAAAGFGYSKLLGHRKEEPYRPNEVHHHHYPGGETKTEEKPKHSRAVEHKPMRPKKASTRHGYYLDDNFDAVLDEPRIKENWIIERDFNGDILDVKKIPDADEMI